jgi:hypothetical protein
MFPEQATFWRQDWPGSGGPVGLSEAAAADPAAVLGTVEAGWNWTTVEWVCIGSYPIVTSQYSSTTL